MNERVARPGRPGTRDESPLRTVAVAVGLAALGLGLPLAVLILLGIVLVLAGVALDTWVLGALIVGQFALFVVVGLGYLRWRGFDRGDVVRYLGVDRPTVRDLALILGTWIAMVVATVVVAVVVISVVPELLGAEGTEPAENPAGEAIQTNPELIGVGIVGMFLVVGPAEEILFRGVIQNRLRERLSAVPAIVLAGAIFAVAHTFALAGQDPVAIAMTVTILFVPGLGLGAIYEYTGNIVVPSLLHGFHNSMILLLIWAATMDGEGLSIVLWWGLG